jgi:hypothetical protein
MFLKFTFILFKSFLLLLIIGFIIGKFHEYDLLILIFLILISSYRFYKYLKINPYKYKSIILISGVLLSGILGFTAEVWGVENGYWFYHDLSENRQYPYWLPLAWGLTFMFFHRIEEQVLEVVKINSLKVKVFLIMFLSAVLPTWGEIITINLGVWTYSWPIQFFGVPVLAIFLLVIFHTLICVTFTYSCKKLNIYDPVFNNKTYK